MAEEPPARNVIVQIARNVTNLLEAPVVWFRETIVVPNQKQYPWYHQKMRRVPTIDQCYMDDWCCIYEANMQFKRDKLVDNEILSILRRRFEDCVQYEAPDHKVKCTPFWDYYKKAEENWFSKYGDLGYYGTSVTAYMKQKHRMIWSVAMEKSVAAEKINKKNEHFIKSLALLNQATCVTDEIQEY